MAETFDIIVLGGGIVGASTAYSLAKQSKNVLLLDQYEVGHKQGSSHGDGRVIRFNYTDAIYIELAKLAFPAWEALSADADETLIQETGLLEYGHASTEAIEISADLMEQYDIAFERLTAQDADLRFPQFHFSDDADVLFQPSGAIIFATKALKAFWRLIRVKGGITLPNTRIKSIDVVGDLVTLTSDEGKKFQAPQLIIAAGGWSKQLAASLNLDLPLEITQEILCYFPVSDDVNHRVGAMPTMVEYHPNGEIFYALPIVDIQGVKVGLHHSGNVIEPDNERFVSDKLVSSIKDWAERTFPHINADPIDIHTCLYTNTPDFHFILDKHPEYDNIIIGTGFSGHGFKFAPVLGDILGGIALGQATPIDLSFFGIKRFDQPQNLSKLAGA